MIVLVVLNYNDAVTTIKFVRKIQNYQTINYILIVDNCSTDDSYEQLKVLRDNKVALVRTNKNRGYASGNNYGIQYAMERWRPRYVIISNPDVEFSETMIPKFEQVLSEKKDAVTVTCIMNCTSGIHLPVAWKIPSYWDCLMENLILLKRLFHYSKEYKDTDLKSELLAVEAIPGSFFMADIEKLIEIGGFDENTFLYYEENILGKKIKDRKYKQYLLTNIEYVHNHSISINKSIKKVSDRLRLSEASREYYCRQYLNISGIQMTILKILFKIGLYTYLVGKKIVKKEKSYESC